MKTKNLFLGLIASICFATSIIAQVPTAGLVGYYPFNGNANDLSGGNNNGVVFGGVAITTDRFGNTNSAYSFDGINGYIKISNASNINNNNFTYNWWVTGISFPATEGSNMLEFGSQNFAGGHTGQAFSINNNYVSTTGWRVSSGNADFSVVGFQNGTLPNTNTWYNVTVTRNDSIVRLYVNCQLIASGLTNGLLPYYNSPLDMFIGSRAQLSLTQYFNGKIDDIRIYNRALNQTEINTFCNEGICYQYITVTDTLIINIAITGFNPITYKNTIKVFPNPTHDHIIIDNGNFASLSGYTVRIFNSLGQTVFSSLVNQQQFSVDLSTWSGNGIYFVHVIDAQGNTLDIKKIVLQ
jgi:hypothetical protein